MNITLNRIAELIPKDEKGDFKHGAIKEFANSIGYKSGNIVSMWFNGDSTSYNGKLHEIAAKYNVSVEWLKGETEQKEKSPAPSSAGPNKRELLSLVDEYDDDQCANLLEIIKRMKNI